MKSFQDKVAVVTGAGSGIGRHLAIQLARRGARIAISDINEIGLEETRRLCLAERPTSDVRAYRLDVSDRGAVFDHAERVRTDFGTAHYIFNNAGYTLVGTFANVTLEEIEQQLAVNLWGVIYGTKAFLPMLLQQREGHIVNISSIFGLAGVFAQGPYNISKFGVRGLNECLWWELDGTGVELSSVHPGGIDTEIGRTARVCKYASEREKQLAGSFDGILKTPPQKCAAEILAGVLRGKRRILTGHKSSTVDWLTRLFPSSYFRFLRADLKEEG